MNSENIHILLNKYWNCTSTQAEEEQLRDYFSGPHVSEELKVYIPLFAYTKEERSMATSEEFDQKLSTILQETSKKKSYITVHLFAPVLQVAASVLLITALGLSALLISKQFNKPYFAETYHDPNVAIKDATHALMTLSQALQASEEASRETLHYIDALEIDWSSIDSISSTSGESLNNEEAIKEDEQLKMKTEQEDDL